MKKYYIGWDVGAWHCKKDSKSKDAFAIIDENRNLIGNLWETNGGTDLKSIIHETVDKDKYKRTSFFIKKIFSLCGEEEKYDEDDFFCIAIDTPLGWTSSFRELLTMWSSNTFDKDLQLGDMDSKNNNPLLTRKTEKRFDNPLSVIQDQIGSQSTKAMYLLSLLKPHKINTGVWKTKYPNLTIIETYPAPCMRSLAFIQHMKDIKPEPPTISSPDKFDALVCANLAWCFENPPHNNSIDSPPAEIDPAEGWIFAPETILDSKFGISYPNLIGTKGLSDFLSEIQFAIILSAKETAKEKAKKKAEEVKKANAKEEKAKKKAEEVKKPKPKKAKPKTKVQEEKANAKEAKAKEDVKKEVRFNEQLNMVNQWANTNKQLFAHLSANDWAIKFETLHPDWFKKGTESTEAKKGTKDGKYHSEANRAEFKRFLETTINSLQQGNP